MYMSKDGVEVSNPDSSSGLYIRARNGDLVKAVIPSEYMVFQIGSDHLAPARICVTASLAETDHWSVVWFSQVKRRASTAAASCRLRRTACEALQARRREA
jgi:hypothetical protein